MKTEIAIYLELLSILSIDLTNQKSSLITTCSPEGVKYAFAPTMAPKLSSRPAMRAHRRSWCFCGANKRTEAPSLRAVSRYEDSRGLPVSCTLRRTYKRRRGLKESYNERKKNTVKERESFFDLSPWVKARQSHFFALRQALHFHLPHNCSLREQHLL